MSVVIVGAGPAGLTLAAELALNHIECTVIEKREQRLHQSRAFSLTPLSLELLDMRGIADEMLKHGIPSHLAPLGDGKTTLDFRRLNTRFPYLLTIPQFKTEEILESWAKESGVTIIRQATVTNINKDNNQLTVYYTKNDQTTTIKADYLIGADGANSTVRHNAGIQSTSKKYEKSLMHGDVRLTKPPNRGVFAKTTKRGMTALFKLPENDAYRVIALDHNRMSVPVSHDVTLTEFQESVRALSDQDFGLHAPLWLQRFHSQQIHASHYAKDNIFLVGDAAHTFLPAGGQGLQMCIHSGINLGWKLSAVIKGHSPRSILDSYESERRRLSDKIMRQSAMMFRYEISNDPFSRFLKWTTNQCLQFRVIQEAAIKQLSGLNTHYHTMKKSLPKRHAYHVGDKIQDMDVKLSSSKTQRLFKLLRCRQFIILNASFIPNLDEFIKDTLEGQCISVEAPTLYISYGLRTCIIRPDGFIAWSSKQLENSKNLLQALSHWILIN